MNQLPAEVLLPIFRNLDSNEMVNMMRVSKRWFQVIDKNKTLWRRLVLPPKEGGWTVSTIKLFDSKSQSSLEEVSIELEPWKGLTESKESNEIMQTLEKSKKTLQHLHLYVDSMTRGEELSSLSWRLPNLVECVVDWDPDSPIRLLKVKDQSQVEIVKSSSALKALWIFCPGLLFTSQRHMIDSLVSLHVQNIVPSVTWKKILKGDLAKNLKDLCINVDFDEREEEDDDAWEDSDDEGNPNSAENSFDNSDEGKQDQSPSQDLTLQFPNLRILTISSDTDDWLFPSWMKIPTSSTFICPSELPVNLPSASKIWVLEPEEIQRLGCRCPVLAELRLEISDETDDSYDNPLDDLYDNLSSMLRERENNVRNTIEVEGTRMIQLKTLVLPFELFPEDQLAELKKMVQEVVDLETVERFIEVEI